MHYILYCLSCFLEKILLSCVIFSVFRMLLFLFGKGGGGWAFWLSPGNGLFMKKPGNKSTLTAPGKRKNTVFLQIRNNGCRLLLMS